MAIPDSTRQNFKTILLAIANEDVAIMEVRDMRTGEIGDAIVAVSEEPDGSFMFTPFAFMGREDNPYERYMPVTGLIEKPVESSDDIHESGVQAEAGSGDIVQPNGGEHGPITDSDNKE